MGCAVRVIALFTAKHNFTHEIATEKKAEHILVKTGIYQYMRHPGYMGWYWWTVGSQLILINPICACAFAYVSWKFFHHRIPVEEEGLVEFFGFDYVKYRSVTPTYIPFIK